MVCEKNSLIPHLCPPSLLKFLTFYTKPSSGLPVPLHLLLFSSIHLMLHSYQTLQAVFTTLTHGFATCSCFWLQSPFLCDQLANVYLSWKFQTFWSLSCRLSSFFLCIPIAPMSLIRAFVMCWNINLLP